VINEQKEILIKANDDSSYKLIIYSNKIYLNFLLQKSDDMNSDCYHNKYKYKAITQILKIKEELYPNFEKIIELIVEANLNKRISINTKSNNFIDLIITLPICFKDYKCTFMLSKKVLDIKQKFEMIINEIYNHNNNLESNKIKEMLLDIKNSTEEELNKAKKLNNSLNEKIENNKKILEKNNTKMKILKEEIKKLKDEIIIQFSLQKR
jgi:hypothetical protein